MGPHEARTVANSSTESPGNRRGLAPHHTWPWPELACRWHLPHVKPPERTHPPLNGPSEARPQHWAVAVLGIHETLIPSCLNYRARGICDAPRRTGSASPSLIYHEFDFAALALCLVSSDHRSV